VGLLTMNVLVVIGGGITIAFLVRFLIALHTDVRIVPSMRAAVQHLGQEQPSDRGKLIIMNSDIRHRARLSTKSQKAMMVALAGLLLGLGTRGAAQTSEASASAEEVRELRALVQQLQTRVAQLETHSSKAETAQPEAPVADSSKAANHASELSGDDRGVLDFFRGTTINLGIDGYYGYNFNRPIGRVNLLRAYDVSSNSFSLNQANLVFEQTPDVAAGRRFGARLDLQFGQATEASQGNPANEPRPQVYRPVWQAYGTYVAPLGKGLTVDFGKWASPLGIESNYSKDQMNYSRSYLFNLLPFYHQGVRATYQFNGAVSVMYAVVNGVQQAEDFNGFKSQMVSLTIHPTKSVSWSTTYHNGQEQRDAEPGAPTPNGRLHIVDSNATWTVNPKLTLAVEGDYLISRVFSESAPAHVAGGAGYARYQLTPRVALAARGEYLSDRGGFFSGSTQALKETTLTYEYKFADGFLARAEWRRDFSNQPYFLTETPDVLKKEQNTATLGLMWWWGRKQGSW
jgi:hypothetical protein